MGGRVGGAAGGPLLGMQSAGAAGVGRAGPLAAGQATLVKSTPLRGESPNIATLDLGVLIQSSDPQYTLFEGTSPADWSIASAYSDTTTLQKKEQISVLLDSAQMGGIALSVGVVWWASRVTGVIGSLLASAPAWRHLDPLPVVGRDDEEKTEGEWQGYDDRDIDADEMAVSMVLEGPRQAMSMGV